MNDQLVRNTIESLIDYSAGLPDDPATLHDRWGRLVQPVLNIYRAYIKSEGVPTRIPKKDRQLLVDNGMLEEYTATDGTKYYGFTKAGWLVCQLAWKLKGVPSLERLDNQAATIKALEAENRRLQRDIASLEYRMKQQEVA